MPCVFSMLPFGIYDHWKELETSVDVMYLLGWSDSTQKMLTWLHIITASLHHLDLSISGLLFVSDWKCTLFLSPLLCSIIIPLSPTFFAYKIMFCVIHLIAQTRNLNPNNQGGKLDSKISFLLFQFLVFLLSAKVFFVKIK